MAVMELGKKRSFLNKIGVPYVCVSSEGCRSFVSTHLVELQANLKGLVDSKDITVDEAQTIEDTARKAGLLPDTNAVFEKVCAFKLPDGFESFADFKVCTDCEHSLVHGYIVGRDTGKTIAGPFMTLTDGFRECEDGVSGADDSPRVLSGIFVFQQMLETGLAKDDAEMIARTEALPDDNPDKMALVSSRQRQADIKRLTDLFDGFVGEIFGNFIRGSRRNKDRAEDVTGDVPPEDVKR